MKSLIVAVFALVFANQAFASLWCATESQGTPSELATRGLPTLPFQEVQVDLMGTSGQIQVDIRDNYDGTHPIERFYWQSGSAEPSGSVGGVLLGRYVTAGEGSSGTLELTTAGRVVLKVTLKGREDRAPYEFACEIPGDYRKSYSGRE